MLVEVCSCVVDEFWLAWIRPLLTNIFLPFIEFFCENPDNVDTLKGCSMQPLQTFSMVPCVFWSGLLNCKSGIRTSQAEEDNDQADDEVNASAEEAQIALPQNEEKRQKVKKLNQRLFRGSKNSIHQLHGLILLTLGTLFLILKIETSN